MKQIIVFVLIALIKGAFAGVCENSFLKLKTASQTKIEKDAQINFERDLQAIRTSKQEPLLAEQGFSPAFYRGVDQVREFNRVAQYLREIKAKPKLTHIPYFAEQAEKMLDTFTTAFKQQNKGNLEFLENRLNMLKNFKKELQERVKNQAVTYDWWANFNTKLAMLADQSFNFAYFSGTDKDIEMMMIVFSFLGLENGLVRGIQTFDEIKKQIFPKEIIFFTMDAHGVMAFNRLEGQSYLVGVTAKTWEADNLTMGPFRFFEHDLEHINFYKPINRDLSTKEIRLRDEKIKKRLNSISNKSDQEKAEFVLFIFKHETISDPSVLEILREGVVQESNGYGMKINKQLSREEKREYLMKVLEAHILYLFTQEDFKELFPESIKTNRERLLFAQELSYIFNNLFFDIFIP